MATFCLEIHTDENIHKINHAFNVTSFQAFKCTLTHLFQLQSYNILAACGIDEEGINPVIKVYNLDNTNKQGVPFCSRVQSAIPEDNNPSYVSCFAVHENLTMMAVGFDQKSWLKVVERVGRILKINISTKGFCGRPVSCNSS